MSNATAISTTSSVKRASQPWEISDFELSDLKYARLLSVCRHEISKSYIEKVFENDAARALIAHVPFDSLFLYAILIYHTRVSYMYIDLLCSHSRHGGDLMRRFIADHGHEVIALDAVSGKKAFYERFGFRSVHGLDMVRFPEGWTPLNETVLADLADTTTHEVKLSEADLSKLGWSDMATVAHSRLNEALRAFAMRALEQQSQDDAPELDDEVYDILFRRCKDVLGSLLWTNRRAFDLTLVYVARLMEELSAMRGDDLITGQDVIDVKDVIAMDLLE